MTLNLRVATPQHKRTQGKRSGRSNTVTAKGVEIALLRNMPSYPRQHLWEGWFEATPQLLTTTVTSGLIANAFNVTANSIGNFATRFGATFDEYRIIGVKMQARCFSSTNPGLMVAWFDEKDGAAPTLAEAQQKMVTAFSASDVRGKHQIKWHARDPVDLEYTVISTIVTPIPVTYKIYTNTANFGSSAVATPYIELVPQLRVQFRGLQS